MTRSRLPVLLIALVLVACGARSELVGTVAPDASSGMDGPFPDPVAPDDRPGEVIVPGPPDGSRPIVEVEVNPSDVGLELGVWTAFVALATVDDRSVIDMTRWCAWSSSDPAVFEVTPGAMGRALRAGRVEVSAVCAGVRGSSRISVATGRLQRLELRPADSVVGRATTRQVQAWALYDDGALYVVDESSDWVSSAPVVAEVSTVARRRGLVTGVAPGRATITASFQGRVASAMVTVPEARLRSIAIEPVTFVTGIGARFPLRARGTLDDGTPVDVTRTVEWTSSNPAAVSVLAEGAALACSPGLATVTARTETLVAAVLLTVVPGEPSDLVLAPDRVTLSPGESTLLNVTATFPDGSYLEVGSGAGWRVSDPSVVRAGFDPARPGRIEALATGRATVTAQFMSLTTDTEVTVR